VNESRESENRSTGGVWTVLNRLMIAAVILAFCALVWLNLMPILKSRNEESVRIDQLRSEIAKQKATLSRRTREEELLKNDPAYVEMIARDRLDVMKPGETIIRLEPGRSQTPTAVAPLKN